MPIPSRQAIRATTLRRRPILPPVVDVSDKCWVMDSDSGACVAWHVARFVGNSFVVWDDDTESGERAL